MHGDTIPTSVTSQSSHPLVLISNPPYIPENETLMDDVQNYEPQQALFSGTDGMDVLNTLVKQYKENEQIIGCVFECRKEQAQQLATLLE